MNDVPRQTRRLTPDELVAARRELIAADPIGTLDDPGHLSSKLTPRQDRAGLLVAAIVAFWGTVLVAAFGDSPVVRGVGAFVGILAVVVLLAGTTLTVTARIRAVDTRDQS